MRGLLREQGLEDAVEVDSAGTGDWHAGSPPDARATAAAQARGVTLAGAARQITSADFRTWSRPSRSARLSITVRRWRVPSCRT